MFTMGDRVRHEKCPELDLQFRNYDCEEGWCCVISEKSGLVTKMRLEGLSHREEKLTHTHVESVPISSAEKAFIPWIYCVECGEWLRKFETEK